MRMFSRKLLSATKDGTGAGITGYEQGNEGSKGEKGESSSGAGAEDRSTSENGKKNDNTEGGKEDANQKGKGQKTYSEEDIEKLKADYEQKIAHAADEALKKAAMKPEEKEEYELEQSRRELEEKEKELNLRQLRLDTLDILEKQGVNKDFLDFVVDTDLKATEKRTERFKKLFDKAVNERVAASFAGKTPPAGLGGDESNSVAEQFRKGMGGL